MSPARVRPSLIAGAALAAAYCVVAMFGLRYATIGASITPVWPPTGVALAGLVLLGRRYWPAIFVGALLANAMTPDPLIAAVGIACGNTAEAILGAWLLSRAAGEKPVALGTLGGVAALVFLAAPLAAAVSATVGVASLRASGALPPDALFGDAFGFWWSGDVLGALVVAPVILTWAAPAPHLEWRRHAAELVLLGGVCVLVAWVVLGRVFPASLLPEAQQRYLLFPFVIAAALRHGPRGASLITLVVAVAAVVGAGWGEGPLAAPSTAAGLLVYLGVLAVTGLTLGAVAEQNRRAGAALRVANAEAARQNRELRSHERELQAAQRELARYAGSLEQRLQGALASVPDVVYSADPERRTLHYISPASTTVLGYSPQELQADPGLWPRAVHPEDRSRQRAELARLLRSHQRGSFEYRLCRPDGAVRWIRETDVPITDADGVTVRVDGIARDITVERGIEEQLRLAQKMEALGTFAGGVAHDFNNMLAVIKSSVDLVLGQLDANGALREDLEQIDESVIRASALTRQLVAFGRREVHEPRPLDLNPLIERTIRLLRRIIGEDIRLTFRPTAASTTVLADAGKMEQVLMNLSANARDAMGAPDARPGAGPTGGELTISTDRARLDDEFALAHPWAQPGDYVRVTVSDKGSGMDAATQERMFEPFFSTKEAGRGSGLGLAVVYSIVQQHRGLIEVESRPHEGTTIRIYLPFHPAPAEELAEGDDAGALVGGTETILLAEDDPALRVTATRLLERLGYRVIAVATGKEALALLTQQDDIALAVLDMVMPDLGGPQVFARVRWRIPRLRFVFTTGYSPRSSPAAGGGPPVEVLYKPYGLHALAGAVLRALGGV